MNIFEKEKEKKEKEMYRNSVTQSLENLEQKSINFTEISNELGNSIEEITFLLETLIDEQKKTNLLLARTLNKSIKTTLDEINLKNHVGKNILLCSEDKDKALDYAIKIASYNDAKMFDLFSKKVGLKELISIASTWEEDTNIVIDLTKLSINVIETLNEMIRKNKITFTIGAGKSSKDFTLKIKKCHYIMTAEYKELLPNSLLNSVDEII